MGTAADQVALDGRVDGEDLGPDEDERLAEVRLRAKNAKSLTTVTGERTHTFTDNNIGHLPR